MQMKEVRSNLGKKVIYVNERAGIENEYILNACILRKTEKEIIAQAEIQDLKANSISIVKLESIKEIKTSGNEKEFENALKEY